MPDSKPYHPSSFAFATTAVAEDLERIAEMLRYSLRGAMAFAVQAGIEDAIERLTLQAAALREIASKQHQNELPSHVAAEAPSLATVADDWLPSVDPDAEGPSFDDPPDEPRRR